MKFDSELQIGRSAGNGVGSQGDDADESFSDADLRGAPIAAQGPMERIRFDRAYYNAITKVTPPELMAALQRAGRTSGDEYPVIRRCR